MSVRIRMKKMGRTHRPFFRICVMDARSPRDGKTIEDVGSYDPMVRDKSQRVSMKLDRIDYWLSVGALPTEKVEVLIRKFREGKWGVAKEPPPMIAPKMPEPKAEAPAEAEAEKADSAE
ncbi:MAG: 30S ribosomal protein S16 [Planctomycetaceae bacterium]|nr:30S ribosomal protein S16 [Planctomycetaceae bacterium]